MSLFTNEDGQIGGKIGLQNVPAGPASEVEAHRHLVPIAGWVRLQADGMILKRICHQTDHSLSVGHNVHQQVIGQLNVLAHLGNANTGK